MSEQVTTENGGIKAPGAGLWVGFDTMHIMDNRSYTIHE